MNAIEQFRADLGARMKASGESQLKLSRLYGVQQGALSRFLNGKTGLSFPYILKLWPFVYGGEFPERPELPYGPKA